MAAASTKSDAAAASNLAEPVLAVSARPVPSPRSRAVAAAAPTSDAGNPSTAAVIAQAEPTEFASSGSMSLVESTPPEPRSETVIVAAMGEGDVSPAQAVEIVSRKGSNSGRNYGIVLGMYRSKAEADRLVMQIALRQGDALSGAARHVANTNRGFQPSFANLTLADAQLTCEQLQANQQECSVVGP